ncbi:MAG: 1-acyl-sn-glycerol-3-phosphate acyltransferase [Bacteroidaceae bacterium]|nr:1-acyl-sn-glycerol-3-phosphate acyltransferase [Bacteroidaceae bacterium]
MTILLYRIYQIIISPLLLLATGLTAITVIIGCTVGNAAFWSYHPGRLWSKVMIRLLLLPVKIEGLENIKQGQSYVMIANHQGSFDIFLIYGYLGRSFKWMMKQSLRNIPLVGKACESSGFIFVDKRGPKKIQETYDRARNILKHGTSVVVFPEGARTWDGKMQPFKRGAFQLAEELQLPLLPMTIQGSYEVLSRSRGFNFVNWHPLRLIIHPAIPPCPRTATSERELMEKATEIISSSLSKS